MVGDILSIIENKPQNYLINGDFAISQRFGSLNISPSLKYGVDRWFFANGADCERAAEVGQDFKFSLRTTASVSGNTHLQRIESGFIRHLKGKIVTFSIKLRLESGALGDVPMLRIGYADSQDDFSTTTLVSDNILESDALIDGTYRLFKKSFLVTDEMADNGFYLQVGDFSSGTNVIRYAQAMLNEGQYAARFQLAGKNFVKELELCRRYFEKSYDLDIPLGSVGASAYAGATTMTQASAGSYAQTTPYKTLKRVTPVVTIYNPSTGASASVRASNVTNQTVVNSTIDGNPVSGRNQLTVSPQVPGGSSVTYHFASDAEL